VVNFTLRPLYYQGKNPSQPGGWVGPRDRVDVVVRRKIPNPYRDSNLRSTSP
jgi:hypothetical protein